MNFVSEIFNKLNMPLLYPGLTGMLIAMACAVNGILMYVNIHAWIPPMSLVLQLTRAIVLIWLVMCTYILITSWRKTLAQIFISVVVIFMAVNCTFDLFVYSIYHVPFTYDFLVAIVDTTRVEAADFLSTYFNREFILYLLGSAGIFIAIYSILNRMKPVLYNFVKNYLYVTGFIVVSILTICTILNISYRSVMGANTDITAKLIALTEYKPAQKITAILPPLTFDSSVNPPTMIVIIVGESHSKDHSQIYGYTRSTQPRLTEMASDSTIFIFHNAKTSASYTIGTFKEIIGTWSHSLPDNILWYRCPTFFQIAKAAGYYTAWISNQARIGLGDSPISTMSELADTSLWTNDGIKYHKMYDDAIIKLLSKTPNNGKRLDLIHLIGSHMMYEDRFPKNRSKFTAKDYTNSPIWQRQILADYDNSILYNDSVLKEIFQCFKAQDALVIYFSDHSEDLNQSSNNFFGHGQPRNSESYRITERVPFIVYLGDSCRIKHPELLERVTNSIDREINTTNLTYTIMDIIGAEMHGWTKASTHSFFSKN